jgi:hypothetical protein
MRLFRSAPTAACGSIPPPVAPAPDPRPPVPSNLPLVFSACAAAIPRVPFTLVAILRVSVTRIAVCRLLASALRAARPNRTTARRGRWACAGRGRNGSQGCRYGCQVRLSGTALRYGSQVLLRAASAPVILAHTRAPSSPISAHLPSPHRRTYKAYTHAHPRTFHAHSKPHPRN